jgi:hypothetical protein
MPKCLNLASVHFDFLAVPKIMTPDARTQKIYTRVTPAILRAFSVKCAELGLSKPEAAELAIERWLGEPGSQPTPIEFTCHFCRAEYQIFPGAPPKAEVVSAPIKSAAGEPPLVDEGSRWMIGEFIRMLADPDEKNTIEMISGYLDVRRKSNQASE